MVSNIESMKELGKAVSPGDLAVVNCYAAWSYSCQKIEPEVEEFSHEYDDVKFYKVDVDEVDPVAQSLGITSMPTFYVFKGGNTVDILTGGDSQALRGAIEMYRED